jgi:hypothetical protein
MALAPRVAASAQSHEVVGAVDSDLVVTLTAGNPNNDLLKFRVSDLPSSGALFQFTESGRGAAILLSDAPINDFEHRIYFVPQAGSTGWPYDSFTFSVGDGEAYSAPASVSVNIISLPVLEVDASSVAPNGAFTLNFLGVSNASYRAWGSTNLTTWSLLGTATQVSSGQFSITDNSATNRPIRFYRVTCP